MCILIGRGQNHHSPFERVVMQLSMNGMNTTVELLGNETNGIQGLVFVACVLLLLH